MTRLLCFAVAMGLSAVVHAETFSFAVGGHHISIRAAHNCYRASCISVSIPGIFISHRKRSDNVVAAPEAAPAKPVPQALAVAAPVPVAVPAHATLSALGTPAQTKAAVIAPPSPPEPVNTAVTEKPVEQMAAAGSALDKLPADEPSVEPAVEKPPVTPQSVAESPAPGPAPPLEAAKLIDTERYTPLGDWQTAGKVGAVRIEACGKALCGYLINPSSQAKAESILINMKPNADAEWRGSIFSRASGNIYNATMRLKDANLLRVEACAIGRFFCSGNDWTRIIRQPAALVSRDAASEPRS